MRVCMCSWSFCRSVAYSSYINTSMLGAKEFREVLRYLAMDEPPLLPRSSSSAVEVPAQGSRKRKFVEVASDTPAQLANELYDFGAFLRVGVAADAWLLCGDSLTMTPCLLIDCIRNAIRGRSQFPAERDLVCDDSSDAAAASSSSTTRDHEQRAEHFLPQPGRSPR